MTLLLAVWLARVGGKIPVVRHLAILLVTLSVYDVANGIALSAGTFPVPWFILPVALILTPAATLGFYGAYRNGQRLSPMDKSWVGKWMIRIWPAAIVLATVTIFVPQLWVRDGNAGPLFILVGVTYVLFAVLALELTRDAVKETEDAGKRRSMLFLALGFSFVPAYVATSELLFLDILKLQETTGLFFSLAHYIAIGAGVVLVAMFVILARAALKTKQEQQKVDVAWFMLVLVGPGISVMIQLLFILFGAYNLQLSVAIEGVWAMLFPLMAALAVARFHSFGITGDSRPGLRILLFGILFPVVFAFGWMAGLNSFPNAPAWVIALIFMAALAVFSKMLWRQSDKWAGAVLGIPEANEYIKEVEAKPDA